MSILKEHNWEPFVHDCLSQLIKKHQCDSGTPRSQQPYLVFDFDETCIFGDIEDHLMRYQVENILFNMTPERFKALLVNNIDALDQPIGDQVANYGDLVADLVVHYQWLYDHYIQGDWDLDRVKKQPDYVSFRAKMIYLYYHIHQVFKYQQGAIWPTYWFDGMSQADLNDVVADVVAEYLNAPRKNEWFTTHPDADNKIEQLSVNMISGFRFYPEVIDLINTGYDHGILSYIVSASPHGLMQAMASHLPFNIPANRIIGMPHGENSQGQLTAEIVDDRLMTAKVGKSETIRSILMPLHGGQAPIGVFGDSMGDYNMLTDFADTEVSLLINRCLNNETQTLVQRSIDQYGTTDARYLLQGRNENIGSFISDRQSILFGSKELQLKSE